MTNLYVIKTKRREPETAPDYLCADGKVHVRLKAFEAGVRISGFMDKLAFVLTYMFDRQIAGLPPEHLKSLFDGYGDDDGFFAAASERLMTTPAFEELERDVMESLDGCCGIKILRAYYRKASVRTKLDSLGHLCEVRGLSDAEALSNDPGFAYSYMCFMSPTAGGMKSILFDDGIEFWLVDGDDAPTKETMKYVARAKRKKVRAAGLTTERPVDLWNWLDK